ncbi:alpha carbonic anhydrase [Lyophyllum atratum]|nr:alpha carbonic anhydrase [Lyophyllum atratum]
MRSNFMVVSAPAPSTSSHLFITPPYKVFGGGYHESFLEVRPRDVHPIDNFSYTGVTGPLGWAGLDPQNKACSTSRIQSPINLDSSIKPPRSHPTLKFGRVEKAEVVNVGTTLKVYPAGRTTTFEGKEYVLKEFHFHTPSEHRIELEYFPFEVHFVHKAADNTSLVLGALFELTTDGSTTDFLIVLAASLSKLRKPGSTTETGPLDLRSVEHLFESTPLFHYTGSLTTPPCTPGIMWLVARQRLPLNVQTFLMFKKVLKFNSRYTQNTLGRTNLIEVAANDLPK